MTDYEKLKSIINEIKTLITEQETYDTPKFKAWYSKTGRFLARKFGEKSREMIDFKNINFESMSFDYGEEVMACRRGLQNAEAILSTYLEDLEEMTNIVVTSKKSSTYSRVFVVHGHDGELRESVARIIEKQGLEAIILSEQANQGRTIIEKFENYSDVDGAICLFTADDIGKSKKETADKARARQNVVLETGYFMGKLGRSHVVILADNGIEIPSDLSGVVYTNTANWQVDLLRELKAMGYTVDFNKLF